MSTIGVSTERGVVRGVLLGAEPSDGGAERELAVAREQTVADPSDTAAAVVSMLDSIDADKIKGVTVNGAAVAYRDADERHAIVSGLAASRWSTSSLVSAKSAQLASLNEMPELAEYRNLLMYEVAPGAVSFSVLDPTRTKVLASDSVVASSHTAETIGGSVRRAWELLDESEVAPDAVVLFGSRAGDPDVIPVLEMGFSAPVVRPQAAEYTTARGAALLAARDIPRSGSAVAAAAAAGGIGAGASRSKKPYIIAAAAAVLLGAGGLGAAGLLSSSNANDVASSNGPASSQGAPAQMGVTGSAASSSESSSSASAAPVQVAPPAPLAAPKPADDAAKDESDDSQPAAAPWTPEQAARAAEQAPSTPEQKPWTPAPEPRTAVAPPPAPAPAPTTVGNPNGTWLFPGESPPPPAGDPAAGAWWANHFELKDRWLHHE